jgi:hypothetical protein
MKKNLLEAEVRPHSAMAAPVIGAALMTAAAALIATKAAHADLAPERGMISLKYLDYQDSQPGKDRIGVHAPSVMVMAPIAGVWSISGTFTSDVVSGASPAYHTEQLTKMKDHRKAVDIGITRYFQRGSLTVGVSHSQESDYISRGFSLQGNVSTEDKNTTINLGVGTSDDTITPSYGGIHEKKNVIDTMVGVTQVLSKQDIAQLNYGFSHGRGYFSDPYKLADERPRERNHRTILARWNHHFALTDGTSHLSYRYYWDSWDIQAHTIAAEYVQPLPYGWTVTPGIRLYSQTEARFYLPTDPANPSWPTFPSANATEYSEDQRLSAFGAVTLGVKVAKQLTPDWLLDVKFERYEQRSDWALSGNRDSALAPFNARTFQFGITRYF